MDVGGVCDPDLVRVSYFEFPLQQVWRRVGRHCDLVARSFVATYRAKLRVAHQACNTLLAAINVSFVQVTVNAWAAVDALAILKEPPDVSHDRCIGHGAGVLCGGLSCEIATALDTQEPSHAAESELTLVFSRKCVLHPASLAKYVATFLGCHAPR